MQNIIFLLRKILEKCIDFVFPPGETQKLTPAEFRRKTSKCIESTIGVHSLFDYKDPLVREAIWELKYRGNGKVTKLIAELLHEEIVDMLAEKKLFEGFEKVLLIPIPSSRGRKKERGFDHIELLTNQLEKIDQSGNFHILKRNLTKIQETISQTKTPNREKRLSNITNSFRVENPAEIKDSCILLLDDVTTTGATIEEAKRVLKKAGAKKIFAVTFAH